MLDRYGSKLLGAGTAVAVAAIFTFAAPNTADAQVSVGVQGSYGTEIEAVGVGARVNYALQGTEGFGLAGSFDYFFPDNFDWWEINANGTYAFSGGTSLSPYVGAGLNYANVSTSGSTGGTTFSASSSEAGLNLLGGLQFGSGSGITPYVEGRYATTGAGQLYLTGGILF